jgi:hypothetical protein
VTDVLELAALAVVAALGCVVALWLMVIFGNS